MKYRLHRYSAGAATTLVVLLVLLGVMLFAWVNRQDIYDWSRLRRYDPPDEIAQLAFDTTMSNEARRLFYIYHPELNDREAFSHNCSGFGEQTIVLGCYVSMKGIYLFDVDDQRLEGVEQVTAAHEMLHVAYERLSQRERGKVDKMTAEAFKSVTDERIKRTVENYRQRDPSVVPNELHSILATEVRNLTPDLENYYRRYFTNRLAVVGFSEDYEGVLTARRNKATTLELQISSLKTDIEQLEQSLTAEREALRADRAEVDSQQEAAAYNQRVASYNNDVQTLNAQINKYNRLVEEYRDIALETKELYQALDSRPML